MLFRKDIEPRCAYCVHAVILIGDEFACKKYGVVSGGYECKKFKYDPLKRTPPKTVTMQRKSYNPQDFSI